jgi:diaminopimelate epimerase
MRFVKMHGIGNDYIYLDAWNDPALAERDDLPALARLMSDRHTGVGSDGLILVCRPTAAAERAADVRMRMFNADGSESEMCGNGIRCVAKFAHDRLGIRARPMRVETGAGVLPIDYKLEGGKVVEATVNVGEPVLELARVPVDESELAFKGTEHHWGVELSRDRCEVATFVSMGNPHAVIFEPQHARSKNMTLDELQQLPLEQLGPLLEHHPAFPRRINVHYVSVQSRGEATMRTWERGSGITMACGTGACAVLAAGVLTARLDREALLHLPGGDLRIAWDEGTNHIFMTGPATEVFEGTWRED